MTDMTLCGWRVRSSLPLPELRPWTGTDDHPPDVTILCGTVPPLPVDLLHSGPLLQIARDGSSRFTIPEVAAYHVDAAGRTVVIEPQIAAGSPSVRTFLFGTVLAILCQRRGLLPIHACCARFDGPTGPCAVAFSGVSGAGKSTLAAALVARGYHLLADDVTVLDMVDGRAVVRPALPRIKLWRAVLDRMKRPIDGLERVREELDKYSLPLDGQFCHDLLPLGAIHHIKRVADERHAERLALRGLDATLHLSGAVYQDRTLMRFAGSRPILFGQVTRFAAAIPYHNRLIFLDGMDRLDALIEDLATLHEGA